MDLVHEYRTLLAKEQAMQDMAKGAAIAELNETLDGMEAQQ